ncbi:hypothetical protein [Leptobacterium sp. I13]|uniref:hypothetical protein n=1 Tax=Leptobacterium meishanense TaxID=3128904 RepID=UPI0030EB86CD
MRFYTFLLFFLICGSFSFSQEIPSNYRTKKVAVQDTIVIDSVNINNSFFKLYDNQGEKIDSSFYNVDYENALLLLKQHFLPPSDSIVIEYLRYPDFLTKKYRLLDRSLIVDGPVDLNDRYVLKEPESISPELFDGLTTSGSISRGITVGNNQNAVLNSQLDLQVSGKISNDILLSASIRDANIPLQESGYSQRLDEFDQIFIELQSKNWNIRAGDVDLINTDSYFMQFTKKIQGVSLNATINHKNAATQIFGAGALVRGNFTQSQFQGQEGNQGPYKLLGPNDELFILIVSGSERVYVNGLPLQRGENNDYVIDYNAGEIIFTSKYPITSDMRITVEYQFTNNNYTRFIAYAGATHKTNTFTLGTYLYSESDAKNQPMQEDLTEEQGRILVAAGDDPSLMNAPSAIPASFSENRVLYRKETLNNEEIFVFSTNPEDELFSVRFTNVGTNQGNYILNTTIAGGRVFEYIPPANGIPQGSYEPIVPLNAPTRLQIAVLNGFYNPSDKTTVSFEGAVSANDLNLFSNIDDSDNTGLAGRVSLKQNLFNKAWKSNFHGSFDYIQKEFRNMEGLYQVEFSRDWNLPNRPNNQLQNLSGLLGDQQLLKSGIAFYHPSKGNASYQFEFLDFKEFATGTRHLINTDLILDKFHIQGNASLLKNDAITSSSTFFRLFSRTTYSFHKAWAGVNVRLEDNRQRAKSNDSLTPISQRFNEYGSFFGVGDSTKTFIEVGYKYRINDSIQLNKLAKVNTSKTYYLNSKLLSNESTNLAAFISFRDFENTDPDISNEKSLNSRVLYNQFLLKKMVAVNTVYETNSGTLPQQNFTYIEVDPGQGAFTWNDYNNNGIQELDEFEEALFQDEATYIRVLLPNQIFIKTHQNKFSQSITMNLAKWSNSNGIKKFFSHFYNQSAYLIDRKIRREGDNFNLNPFNANKDDLLGLNQNFRNVLFYNRGKQNYTTSYTYLRTKSKSLLITGSQENILESHQLQFSHKLNTFWLINLTGISSIAESISENFTSRNFDVVSMSLSPKISYLATQNSRFSVFYEFESKENQLGNMETLIRQNFGVSFSYANEQKVSISGAFNFFKNNFEGNAFSPVGYQLLEGLQPGNNFTWNFLAQKRLTKFLDLNLSYFGRKSEGSDTIHTGTIQLKAYF